MQLKEFKSLPQMVRDLCSQPESSAFHWKDSEGWHAYQPTEFLGDLRSLATALKGLGIQAHQGVGIIAPSSPHWFLADLAIQICHAWTVPLFPNLARETFNHQCKDADIDVLFIANAHQLDESLTEELKNFRTIIILDEHSIDHPNQKFLSELLIQGQKLREEEGDSVFDQKVDSIDEHDIATIIYTSGSTGMPKGAEITHRNLLFQLEGAFERYPVDPAKDSVLSILPVAHVFERMVVYYFLSQKLPIWFGRDPKEVASYLHEIRPTIITMVPRILERLYEKLSTSGSTKPFPLNIVVHLACSYAKKADPQRNSLRKRFFDKLVYAKMREALGNSLELIVSGSSALSPAVHRFLLNLGLPVFEGYGLTECSPVIAAGHCKAWKLGSVGQGFPHIDIRIGENQEVQVQSAGVMKGYHHAPKETQKMYTEDGWFRTGDEGFLDDEGFLFITGRLKELFKTSTGKYVRPIPIEQGLSRHRLIETAMVIADNRKFVSALLFLDHAQAQIMLHHYNDYDPARAIQSRHILERITRQIERVNNRLNEWEKIRKWILLPDTLSPENGLLTPTLKIRRNQIERYFKNDIDHLYISQEPA